MRIEINSQKGGIATISGFQTDYTALLNETNSVIDALNRMKSYSYSMNGGLGVLQNAVGDIDSRIQAEESKRTALQAAQQKCNNFITLVSQTDNSCAEMVSQNQEEFYQVNQWAVPSALASMMDSWYQSAKSWLKKALGVIEENVDHAFKVYTETDFSSMSSEEIRTYIDELIQKKREGTITPDDEIRLRALYNYMSKKVSVGWRLDDLKLRNELYALVYPDEMERIKEQLSDEFDGLSDDKKTMIVYYMTCGSDTATANQLYDVTHTDNNTFATTGMIEDYNDNHPSACAEQGNFHLDNMTVIENNDGSVVFRCDARQSPAASSYGALIVYDEHGNVQDVVVLDRYQNPTDLPSAINTIKNQFKNEDYAETTVDVTIPKGGYLQVTDDPNEIELIRATKGIEEIATDTIQDIGEDFIEDEIIPIDETSILGRAKAAWEVVKKVAWVTDKLENVLWSEQERGTGSLIIYNN